jgi:cobyrinic acid a,c-diamide synthase
MRASLRAFAVAGGAVYAECGGLVYLSRSVRSGGDEAPEAAMGERPATLPPLTQTRTHAHTC